MKATSRGTRRGPHTSSAGSQGQKGGARVAEAAGNLWGHSAGWGRGPCASGPPGLPLQGWALGSSASPELTVVPQPVRGPHADSLVPAGSQP